jgi:hypothetical protein
MILNRISGLPVLDTSGKLAGVVTEGVQRCNPSNLVLAEIDKQPWSPGSLINVIVRDGIVELWGTILDERKRQALRVAAENSPGTRQVKDHLVWVEPMSGMVSEAPDWEREPIVKPG